MWFFKISEMHYRIWLFAFANAPNPKLLCTFQRSHVGMTNVSMNCRY